MTSNIFQFIIFLFSLITLSNLPSTNVDGHTSSTQAVLGRDVERKTRVAQMGYAVEAFRVTQGDYPLAASWGEDLVSKGELSGIPGGMKYETNRPCSENSRPAIEPNYCYRLQGDQFVVYANLENLADQCAGESSVTAYLSQQGRTVEICGELPTNLDDIAFIE